ncbi:uncharacterized protein LOC113350933 [Papaver somniferum]|uniref:uncharacterized protein LOC113350933 n=1 Tax=Papaver somniferum TaxID=3469 RepID=UPI000E6FB861|nr:uncharacterized protein LOC113350933 [Papaver somniferum]
MVEGRRQKYFFSHSFTSHIRRLNRIKHLMVDRVLTDDRTKIKNNIINHFQHLFKEELVTRPPIEDLEFGCISEEESIAVESEISEEEVVDAINDLEAVKAPDPNGYPIIFFKKCWSFLKEDVRITIAEFNTEGKINSLHYATFICLVPKKNHVESVLDLRPSIYKIISKVLATRLRILIPKIISETQFAYVEGRQIHDSILIASELVDSKIKDKTPGIICKIDLEKAFDRISWSYLQEILRKIRFLR